MTIFHLAHTLAGRLYVVSDIEAKTPDDALDLARSGADDDPNLMRGQRFVMDNRDPMDEYELVHAGFLAETSDYSVVDGHRYPDLRAALVDLTHLAATLNARQHAGLVITPTMWSVLHQRTNEARALLETIPPQV